MKCKGCTNSRTLGQHRQNFMHGASWKIVQRIDTMEYVVLLFCGLLPGTRFCPPWRKKSCRRQFMHHIGRAATGCRSFMEKAWKTAKKLTVRHQAPPVDFSAASGTRKAKQPRWSAYRKYESEWVCSRGYSMWTYLEAGNYLVNEKKDGREYEYVLAVI